ncbi:hypothetical protein PAXRUDRAFT_378244 [Paxillus rubicundulus Ve08.2h10]|uniref:Uncharacterized protein n=1 Tax=Paxillus rubicundulus Ve08.2h10 TaxID=930991 RepID=A0A0D0E971_9AGAM|nr:hypothetical protein PAXRUDRAFT_378244 [Paxillus rubicundulus Ve08.2h10]
MHYIVNRLYTTFWAAISGPGKVPPASTVLGHVSAMPWTELNPTYDRGNPSGAIILLATSSCDTGPRTLGPLEDDRLYCQSSATTNAGWTKASARARHAVICMVAVVTKEVAIMNGEAPAWLF